MHIYDAEYCKGLIKRVAIPNHTVLETCIEITEDNKTAYRVILDEITCKTFTLNHEYVMEAINQLTWPDTTGLLKNLDIYYVPLPASDHSNAHFVRLKNPSIFLWGRGTPEPRYKQHYLITHELGHLVENLYTDNLDEYYALRGWPREVRVHWVTDPDGTERLVSSETWKNEFTEDWDNCPIEWFAEDFRMLYGCGTAKQDSWSCTCPLPNQEVKDYFDTLISKKIKLQR